MVIHERSPAPHHDAPPPPDVSPTAIGRAVLVALSQGLVIHASDGRILITNPAADRIFGVRAGQLFGKTLADSGWRTVHEDGSPFPSEEQPAALALATGREVRDVVLGMHRPDGTLSWLWVNAVPVDGHPGPNDPAVVATFTDITEQVQLRDELVEGNDRFRMLAENSADVVIRTGSDGLIDWVSPSILAVLGWEPEEWIGHRPIEFLHPDDHAAITEEIRAVKAGERARGRGEARFATAGGGWRWMSGTGTALRDADGRLIGGVDSLRDITVEVHAREALRDSEQRFRLLAENSTDVVVRTKDGIITWVSPSLLPTTGWRPDEWIGHPNHDFVHPDDVETQLSEFAAAPTTGPGMARRRILAIDGAYHWVESHYQPFVDARGSIDGVISSFRLIDDTVAAEQALDRRARYDELTGLLNRAEVVERLNRILVHPRRAGREIAVAFCDIDDFHYVNEAYGHGGGDEALRVLAARFVTVVREDDLVARFGGDEILVVLPGVHDLEQAIGVGEKLRAQARLPIPVLGGAFPVSASIGVTLAHPGESADSLIARADEAMFAAKASGKDRVVAIGDPLMPEPRSPADEHQPETPHRPA